MSKRLNPKKHKEARRRYRPYTTIVHGGSTQLLKSRIEATEIFRPDIIDAMKQLAR